jgi:hypothetical protein
MDTFYYILSTNRDDCREILHENNEFNHVYRKQAGSRRFLERVLEEIPKAEYPRFEFVFFNRVPQVNNNRCLTRLYSLKDIKEDSSARDEWKGNQYTLHLRLSREFAEPIPFAPGEALWKTLSETRDKDKLANFYCGNRVLLPIPPKDFSIINSYP